MISGGNATAFDDWPSLMSDRNLYGRLFRYRAREARSPLEDFLSEALVDLLGRMPINAASDLLSAVTGMPGVWREAMMTGRADWSTQVSCDGGFADIVLRIGSRPALVIENKLHSGIRVHGGDAGRDNQLTTYGRWLKRMRNPARPSALVLLTHATPPPADFLSGGDYGVNNCAVFTWSRLARWLTRRVSRSGGDTWELLAREIVGFLGEHGMTNDTITNSDMAAAHLFVPSWSRWEHTFAAMWGAVDDLREGLLSRKSSRLELNREGGMLWQWSYAVAPLPHSSWVAFGFRFPDISDWYQEAGLPDHPHFLLIVGSDDGKLPVETIEQLPEKWSIRGAELITACSVHALPGDADGLAESLAEWARDRMSEAASILRGMA